MSHTLTPRERDGLVTMVQMATVLLSQTCMSQKSILYTSLSREPHSHSKRERRSGDHGANGDGIAEPYLYEPEEYHIHLLIS